MRLLRADGSVGIVTGWKALTATRVMYNLEVAQDHTSVVGDGQWVVHNRCDRARLRCLLGPQRFVFQGQHIVPCAFENMDNSVGDFVRAAIRGGWELNGLGNGLALPISPADSVRYGLPLHFRVGGHDAYSNQVARLIRNTIRGWGGIPPDPVAASMMEQITMYLNFRTQSEGRRLTSGGASCSIIDISI